MKLLLFRSIFIISLFLSTAYAHAHVALDYPLGGETFIVGQTIVVQWHIAVPHETLNWDLYFSSDEGVNWTPLQLNMPVSQLTYNWVIPNTLTTQGRIRVFMNNVDQDYLDISMNFTIAPNTTPPFLDAPAEDITIECGTNQQAAIQAWLTNHGGASATNFCDDFAWTHDYTGISDDCGTTGSTQVIFTAADACGFTTTSASIYVLDTQPPVFTSGASDQEGECSGGNLGQYNTWLSNHGGAIATDMCGTIDWTYSTIVTDECGGTTFYTVNFTATDNCGNQATTSANFSLFDTTPPLITRQARDTSIECNTTNQEFFITTWLNQQGGALATDACDPYISWTHNFSGLNIECGASGSAQVTFTAADACGNTSTTAATLNIDDTLSPVILQQAKDIIIDCSDGDQDSVIQAWLDAHAEAIVTDQCGTLTWSHNFNAIPDSCIAPFSQLVTFTVLDECLNGTTLDANLTFVDSIIPQPVGFLDSTYHWTENIAFGNWSQTFTYTISNLPSVFSDTTYYELLKSEDENPSSWQNTEIFFRLQDGIVYVREYNRENILYDFNLTENDTFFGYIDVPLIVDSVDTYYLLNGEPRTRLRLRCEEDLPGTEFYTEWVEGIGNLQGLFARNQYCQIDGEAINLLCLHRNDTLLYDSPLVESCWLLPTSTGNTQAGNFSMYPNPASNILTMDFQSSGFTPMEVRLTDMMGVPQWNTSHPSRITSIPVHDFTPGIYFISVKFDGGIVSRKVILE